MFITEATLRRDPRADLSGYPYSIPAVRHLSRLDFTSPVTFFVGENGSGKSTLLEGIAGAFGLNPEGGTKHVRFATRPSHSTLFRELKLTRTRPAPTDSYFLRAETFYNLASVIERPEDRRAYDLEAFGGNRFTSAHTGRRSWPSCSTACAGMASIASMSRRPRCHPCVSSRCWRPFASWC